MSYDFKKIMAGKTDKELLFVLAGGENDYNPEALQAAKDEYAKRSIPEGALDFVKESYQLNKQIEENNTKAKNETVNLILWLKIATISGLILFAIIASILKL
ncbi:MAG: hypothetical protein ABIP79_14580 [Chitinophagaceae bacterium]